MKTSLTKILDKFEDFAGDHDLISTFRTEPITENTAKNWKYPLMFIDTAALNVSFQRGQVVITVNTYILDRTEKDYDNLSTVLSSTLLTMVDFFTYFWNDDENCSNGFYFSDTGSATPVVFAYDDDVAGYMMPISVQVGEAFNRNKIPLS